MSKPTSVWDAFDRTFETFEKSFENWDSLFNTDIFSSSKALLSSGPYDLPSFPPVNIYAENVDATGAGDYVLEVAISGYKPEDVDVTEETVGIAKFLVVQSKGINDERRNNEISSTLKWFHRGIAGRSFKMSYSIATNVSVKSAKLADGLLKVVLSVEKPLEPTLTRVTKKVPLNTEASEAK